jgi:Fe-S cluster biogenesis protein NfuA
MIRSTLKRGIKKALGIPSRPETVQPAPTRRAAPPAPAPIDQEAHEEVVPVRYAEEAAPSVAEAAPTAPGEVVEEAAEPAIEEAVEVAPEPAVEAAPEEVTEAAPAAPAVATDDDTAGTAIDLAEVQEILDDMVRPALQADGGDIALLKIENNDIYVKLVGSCSSCPSSVMTMKMGVEALLKEEFPQMGELVQVD